MDATARIKAVAARDGWACHYCGLDLFERRDWPGPTTDHKIPRGRGGSDGLVNLVLACSDCNTKKHLKPYLEIVFGGVPESAWVPRRPRRKPVPSPWGGNGFLARERVRKHWQRVRTHRNATSVTVRETS